jgi:hypothetical protein
MTTNAYHLDYKIERKILEFPNNDDIDFGFDEESTIEMYRKDRSLQPASIGAEMARFIWPLALN